jgi:mRNA interferase RelE/StbE
MDRTSGSPGPQVSVSCLKGGEPRPPESFPYGSPDLRRLRAGRYRASDTIDEERLVVQIDHAARLP